MGEGLRTAVVSHAEEGRLSLPRAVALALELEIANHAELSALLSEEWGLDFIDVRRLRGASTAPVQITLAIRPLGADGPSGEVQLRLADVMKENAELLALFSDRVKDSEIASAAVLREREECAKICDRVQGEAEEEFRSRRDRGSGVSAANECAEAIRARGES
jgi:hypothetical protein